MLSGVHVSSVSFLLIWIKVSKVIGPVASFQALQSTTIQYAMSCPFNTILYLSLPCIYVVELS